MLNVQRSRTSKENEFLKSVPRRAGEGNVKWMGRALGKERGDAALVLVGGVDAHAFRLRVAQSHVRRDLSPSCWSHVALAGPLGTRGFGGAKVHEVPLESDIAWGFAPKDNAVVKRDLADYDDAERYPNIAILFLPKAWKEIEPAVAGFMRQRSTLDAPELVLRWLAFLWGVAKAGNPLVDGVGVPSAAFDEVVVASAGYNFTPRLVR